MPLESSRARHNLKGAKMENQSERKSDSKQQATKKQMTERLRTCDFFFFFLEKGESPQKF